MGSEQKAEGSKLRTLTRLSQRERRKLVAESGRDVRVPNGPQITQIKQIGKAKSKSKELRGKR